MWKDPLSKGSALQVLYAGKLIPSERGSFCNLYGEDGQCVRPACSVRDMWHIGANHKRCKGSASIPHQGECVQCGRVAPLTENGYCEGCVLEAQIGKGY